MQIPVEWWSVEVMESYVVAINTKILPQLFQKYKIKPRPEMISQLMFDQQCQSIEYEMKEWLSEVNWGSVK